jgi:hypothetical protein
MSQTSEYTQTDTQTSKGGAMPNIVIDDEVHDYLAKKLRPFIDKTENDVLRRLLLAPAEPAPRPDLASTVTAPSRARPSHKKDVTIHDLLAAGLVEEGARILLRRRGDVMSATICGDGHLEAPDKERRSTPSGIFEHQLGYQINGWARSVYEPTGRPLDELRERYWRGED